MVPLQEDKVLGGQRDGEYWGKKKPEPWLQQRMFMGSDLTRCGLQDAATCWAQRSHKLQGDPGPTALAPPRPRSVPELLQRRGDADVLPLLQPPLTVDQVIHAIYHQLHQFHLHQKHRCD